MMPARHLSVSSTPVGKLGRRLLLIFAALAAATAPASALDLDELTVVTLARDGSWGVAAAASQGPALAAAIRDCPAMAMASATNDCGAQFATTRGGWIVAKLCGDHKIIVAAETRDIAEREAQIGEIDIRRRHVPSLLPCRLILAVDARAPSF